MNDDEAKVTLRYVFGVWVTPEDDERLRRELAAIDEAERSASSAQVGTPDAPR